MHDMCSARATPSGPDDARWVWGLFPPSLPQTTPRLYYFSGLRVDCLRYRLNCRYSPCLGCHGYGRGGGHLGREVLFLVVD